MEVFQNTSIEMIDKSIQFFGINIAVLTISDTRDINNDKSRNLKMGWQKSWQSFN